MGRIIYKSGVGGYSQGLSAVRAARTRARASFVVGARTVRCPIFRPRRGTALPYKCSFTLGIASAARPVGLADRPEIAEQIGHRGRLEEFGRSQRQAAHGAHLLLELAGTAGIERQVPGVVRTRRDFVDQQAPVLGEEKFDAQHADVLEALQNRAGDLDRLRRDLRLRHCAGAIDTSRM